MNIHYGIVCNGKKGKITSINGKKWHDVVNQLYFDKKNLKIAVIGMLRMIGP